MNIVNQVNSNSPTPLRQSEFDWSTVNIRGIERDRFMQIVEEATWRDLDIREHPDFTQVTKKFAQEFAENQPVKRGRVDNTEKSFNVAVEQFKFFLSDTHALDEIPLPISIDLAIEYIRWRAFECPALRGGNSRLSYQERILQSNTFVRTGVNKNTLDRDVWMLSRMSQANALPSPVKTERFRMVYKRVVSEQASSVRPLNLQATPFREYHLQELERLYNAGDSRVTLRDIVIFRTMFEGMLRGEEIRRLQLKHIVVNPGTIGAQIMMEYDKTNKNGPPRYLPISDRCLNFIKQYLQQHSLSLGGAQGELFLLAKGNTHNESHQQTVSESIVYSAFHKASELLLSDEKPFSTHSCRVGAAIWLTLQGYPPQAIMSSGRWASLAMLMLYIRPYIREGAMAEAAEQL